jgi:hypothetical protein
MDEPLAVRLGGCASEWVDGSPVERCCFGEVVLALELRRHRRRLRALVVEDILTESESRTRAGERNWDSGTAGLGLLAVTLNERSCVGVDVGEVWNSFVPVIDSDEEAVITPGPMLCPRARA